jgi:hypothetical protein
MASADLTRRLVQEALARESDTTRQFPPGWGEVIDASHATDLLTPDEWKRFLLNAFQISFHCPDRATHSGGLRFSFADAHTLTGVRFFYRIHEEWTLSGKAADPYFGTGYKTVYALNTFLSGSTVDNRNPIFASLEPGPQLFTVKYIIEMFDTEGDASNLHNFNATAVRVFTFSAPFTLLPVD